MSHHRRSVLRRAYKELLKETFHPALGRSGGILRATARAAFRSGSDRPEKDAARDHIEVAHRTLEFVRFALYSPRSDDQRMCLNTIRNISRIQSETVRARQFARFAGNKKRGTPEALNEASTRADNQLMQVIKDTETSRAIVLSIASEYSVDGKPM